MKKAIKTIFSLLLFAPLMVQAQTSPVCIDSNRINPYFQCPANEFRPVCGCDGRTYLNGCEAYNRHGINNVLYDGVCANDFFYFNFWPNPAAEKIDFYMQVALNENPRATVQIVDINGNVVFFKLLPNVPDEFRYEETIYFAGLKTGLYVMIVNVGAVYKYKKFIKHTIS